MREQRRNKKKSLRKLRRRMQSGSRCGHSLGCKLIRKTLPNQRLVTLRKWGTCLERSKQKQKRNLHMKIELESIRHCKVERNRQRRMQLRLTKSD